ncbi:TPA: hypothetical protein ACR8QZ_000107 [Enterobacter roggenkampii]|uniref:hypothetical protein n=1 Tax=Enterobacter TaxID=547 RepID=UPI00067B658B|nr:MULTISPECIES: hypothetical protein [Enterobacter cloacae complex]BEK78379.1 hypothetical protein EATA8330_12730 [Enterobacter asburiae]ASD58622.1 hypothetical protein WM95_08720 [Enterobacter cloacae complex sp. ECNIH7]MBO4171968.1 hypothetical protein [Enterobacter roggenkampii]MCD2460377.1 hypothetical protein [Enterobacter cloacae complex sp. 2021EL-01261]MCK7352015.1 hypothetical protein [Enterobacter roggenkampii]
MSNEQRIENFESRIQQLEGIAKHLQVRSELTMYIVSAIIGAGGLKKEGVLELIRDANFNAPDISPAIIAKEKEIVSTLVNKVKIS